MCIFDAKWLHLWQVACCSEVYIRLPSLTVQASLKSGEEAAYTEEANAQLPVEDAGTGFGGMTVPQREITVADALFTVQTAIIHDNRSLAERGFYCLVCAPWARSNG